MTNQHYVWKGEKRCQPAVILPASVEKIVRPVDPGNPGTAEIRIAGAHPLYPEIRFENKVRHEAGQEVKRKKGSHPDVANRCRYRRYRS